MQHLNYCRQFIKYATPGINWRGGDEEVKAATRFAINLIGASQKFVLPDNGCVMEDPEFRALDGDAHLHLPFPCVALEFSTSGRLSRVILIAQQQSEMLMIHPVVFDRHEESWSVLDETAIPISGSIDRIGRTARFRVFHEGTPEDVFDWVHKAPAQVVLQFLNALACSNVKIQKSEGGRTQKAMRKKGALPFDDYHLLTIDLPGRAQATDAAGAASGRSPREHLRRGHIRTYESGLKIWVNAAVVNPGVGGRVSKDYRIAA